MNELFLVLCYFCCNIMLLNILLGQEFLWLTLINFLGILIWILIFLFQCRRERNNIYPLFQNLLGFSMVRIFLSFLCPVLNESLCLNVRLCDYEKIVMTCLFFYYLIMFLFFYYKNLILKKKNYKNILIIFNYYIILFINIIIK